MTQLLISVTSVAEAKIALENGADIIDLKDPSAGALGALPLAIVKSIVAYIKSARSPALLTSATIGDLPMHPACITSQIDQLRTTGVDIIKIGFFEAADYQPCLDALLHVSQTGVKLIAVLFAEYTYPTTLIESIKKAGFIGVMLDTAQKNGLTLLDYYPLQVQRSFAQRVLALDLLFGLAGSLRLQHIQSLLTLKPNYLGFRGGVCAAEQRELGLLPEKIQAIRNML